MKTYIVQLEDHDDILSTRDKLSWSKASRVLLVWPRRGKVLERRVDLLILQRHARELGAQLGIVTRSGEVKAHAHELGIPVFADPAQAQQENWRRTRRKGKAPWEERRLTDPQELRARHGSMNGARVKRAWLRWGAFAAGILAFLALVLFFVPEAQVELKPVRQSQELTLNVWASPTIHNASATGGMPAQTLTGVVEGRDQLASSGHSQIPDQPAEGAVLLTNLTEQGLDIPAGTIVLTATSPAVRYTLTQPVQISAGTGKTASAPIRAVMAGSQGNQAKGSVRAMEGPLGLRLTVDNPEPITGGRDRSAAAPTEQDAQTLREKLLTSLQERALEEIRSRVKPEQRLMEGTLHIRAIIEENREPARGQPGDQLQLSMRVEYEALAVSETDLRAVAQAALDANQPAGFEPMAGSLQIDFLSEPTVDAAPVLATPTREAAAAASGDSLGTASPDTTATATSNTSVETAQVTSTTAVAEVTATTARWQIRAAQMIEASLPKFGTIVSIQGRSVAEASQVLQSRLALAEAPRILLYPDWWVRLPYLSFRIHLVKQ